MKKLGKLEELLNEEKARKQAQDRLRRQELGRKWSTILAWCFGLVGTVGGCVQCTGTMEHYKHHPSGLSGIFEPLFIFLAWVGICSVVGWGIGHMIGSDG